MEITAAQWAIRLGKDFTTFVLAKARVTSDLLVIIKICK